MTAQRSFLTSITVEGIGLHTGAPVTLTLKPAPDNTGIIFHRTDLPEGHNSVPALWSAVTDTQLCTVISNDHGAKVGTVEHLMAALAACEIDNAIIEVSGQEVPIVDGSSAPWLTAIHDAGIATQTQARKVIRMVKPLTVEEGDSRVTLSPASNDTATYKGTIAFKHPAIQEQRFEFPLTAQSFAVEIAPARTFGFLQDVEYLRTIGLAKGGSLDNAVVLDEAGVMNEGGLRFADEFIRHKLLDAVGDLYMAGARIQGIYTGHKAGHAINNAIVRALFANTDAWESVAG